MYRILRFIKRLSGMQWLESVPLRDWQMRKARYIVPGEYEFEPGGEGMLEGGRLDGRHGVTYFLSRRVEIPSEWAGDPAGLIVESGGEGLLRVNGISYQGLSRNHSFVPLYLDSFGAAGEAPLLEIELYDPIPEPADPLNNQSTINPPVYTVDIRLVRVNRALQSLLYSVRTAYEAMVLLPEQDLTRSGMHKALYEAMDTTEPLLGSRFNDPEWLGSIEETLRNRIKALVPNPRSNGFMHMVGQSHIDVAWLWPVRETVRKVSRTFSTMNALMEEYPDFVFTQSQPQLYAFAKQQDPELFGKIKARVAEGRWELVGGMWVEPDLNIPSGESLVRQMLVGQMFYEDEFGKRSFIEWLPDTFGYCASLPQMLKLAGVEYFMTTKLNWNDTNKFPHELFHWVGIDGTAIVSYLNHGLNEHTKPHDIHEHWEAFRQKDKLDELALLYGHGDGGGGVTREMIEYVRRSELMAGLPESRFSTAAAYFSEVVKIAPSLPRWHGDLYLELHRGTYTTHARNKRSNRKAELLYRDAEIWSRLALPYGGLEQDRAGQEALREGWKLMLLNQFHDIIPGTSIPEAYVTSAAEYEKVFKLGGETLERSLRTLAAQVAVGGSASGDGGIRVMAGEVGSQIGKMSNGGDDQGTPYIVFNSLGWSRDAVIQISGDAGLAHLGAFDHEGSRLPGDVHADEEDSGGYKLSVTVPAIPAFGYTTIWLRPLVSDAETAAAERESESGSFDDVWETGYYHLEFNRQGEITRWLDKQAGRELVPPGAKANELQLFHDRPLSWDAWDIDPRFEMQRAAEAKLVGKKAAVRGKTADILRLTWEIGESTVQQDIVLYHHDRRVDFKTRVQWNEAHKLLKVAFPVDIVAAKATYEIPFGTLERPTHNNTSWEQAQYEVCGHRWADLSEGDYGVSLMNDCKYGYDIKGGVLRLSLLRAPKWPDVTADLGEHEFTYSLFPHEGDWRAANVVRAAAELNQPAIAVRVDPTDAAPQAAAAVSSTSDPGGAVTSTAAVLPVRRSLIGFEGRSVILDTVKPAERGEGTVLRFYESAGCRDTVSFRMPDSSRSAYIVNLLEDELEPLEVKEGVITLSFRPYEIKSVKCL